MKGEKVLAAAADMLQQARAELVAGNDISPARLFAMEALLTQAVVAGATSTEIRKVTEKLLPDGGALHFTASGEQVAVTLQLWQKRAPVVPST